MKKFFVLIALMMLLVSCERIYINGDLDGMWRLQTVETADTVYRPSNIFYSFQRHLVMLGEHKSEGFPNYYMAVFDRKEDTLRMTNFYKYPPASGVSNSIELKKYYIFSDTVDFCIEFLNGEALVMRNGERVYNFIKW
ncbi:MAG: lipocalin-like domain-containing protein [Bacteroidaceae bacterium]|nr:lipocalin-like domain-containing protein [Bacteroidaceae bacterium]